MNLGMKNVLSTRKFDSNVDNTANDHFFEVPNKSVYISFDPWTPRWILPTLQKKKIKSLGWNTSPMIILVRGGRDQSLIQVCLAWKFIILFPVHTTYVCVTSVNIKVSPHSLNVYAGD